MRLLLLASICLFFSKTAVAGESYINPFDEAMAYYKNRNSDFSESVSYEKFSSLAIAGNIRAKVLTYMVFYEFTDSLANKANEAVKFLVEAAQSGDHEAQYFLGFIISNGIFVEQNVELANKWLKSSAEQGNRQACTLLGINLVTKFMGQLSENESSRLSNSDFDKIRHYLKHVEAMNNANGILALATVIFFHEQNFEEAKRLLSIAKDLGHSDANEFLIDLISLEKKLRAEE